MKKPHAHAPSEKFVILKKGGARKARIDVQFEKCVRDLKHENVGVAVVVYDEDALDGAAHAKVLIIVLQTLQARRHGRILFWLSFLRTNEKGNRSAG